VEEQIYKVTTNNGNFYFKDKGHKIRHRIDGPAVETFKGRSGKKIEGGTWYRNGKLHRLDGPAVDYPGQKEWWINDVRIARLAGNQYIGPKYLQTHL